MNVGLYFGSFNPIHVGHLILANYMVDQQQLDQVWFVVSPHNPLKEKSSLLADHHRLALVKEAIESNPKFRANDIEFGLEQPNYTVKTLALLKEKYPEHNFSLIMGEDNLRTLHKWYNYETILNNYSILVYPRVHRAKIQEEQPELMNHKNVHFCEHAPIMVLSSSYIRDAIKNGCDVKYLLTPEVLKYINEMRFYK